MWVRAPGQGESFSKGFHNAVSGSNGWADYQIPFLVRRGEQPDFVKLNLVIEGGGTTSGSRTSPSAGGRCSQSPPKRRVQTGSLSPCFNGK